MKYKIRFIETYKNYGYVIIEAENKKTAKEKFNDGEYSEDNLNYIKLDDSQGVELENIEEIKE